MGVVKDGREQIRVERTKDSGILRRLRFEGEIKTRVEQVKEDVALSGVMYYI